MYDVTGTSTASGGWSFSKSGGQVVHDEEDAGILADGGELAPFEKLLELFVESLGQFRGLGSGARPWPGAWSAVRAAFSYPFRQTTMGDLAGIGKSGAPYRRPVDTGAAREGRRREGDCGYREDGTGT